MQVIPVVLASDENYLPFAYVAMYSVIKNRRKKYQLLFYLLVPEGTKRVEYNAYWEFDNYEIRYIEIPDSFFSDAVTSIKHITKPTWFRLLIPDVLSKIDKVIYLDVDVLAVNDIYELYDLDVTDVCLAAGLGVNVYFTEDKERELADYLQLPSAKYYFNAGVLVMNLKRMREKKMADAFLKFSKKMWTCQDQDVLNICCYGETRIMPFRYNIYSLGFGYDKEMLETRFSQKEICEALENPCIIHYATEQTKPWRNLKAIKVHEWWNMAQEALSTEFYKSLYKKAEIQTENYIISDLIPKFDLYANTVIFGCGKMAKYIFDLLQKRKLGKVIGFWDNDIGLAGTTYHNIPIELPKVQKNSNVLIVISCQRGVEEIKKQLFELGFHERDIAVYKPGSLETWFGTEIKYRNEMIEKLIPLCNVR